ncbi:MAG: substrate-binding domain-containing protein [Rhodospirillales bacterium]
MPATIRLLSTLAVMGGMRDLCEAYRAQSGAIIEADFAPTVALVQRLRDGEPADIAILTAQGIDDMVAAGIMRPGSRTDVARSFVGVAVKAGAPKPDIATLDTFKAALLAARSVCYSRIGASGLYFAKLIQDLGIADAVNAKATIASTGFTAERLVSGEADLAVQQISELMVVPGIEVVGGLPAAVQTVAIFSAGVLTASTQPDATADFAEFLASKEAEPVLRRTGLEPA